MSNVGYATLQIIPSAQGFLASLSGQVSAPAQAAGVAAGSKMGKGVQTGFMPPVAGLGKAFAGVGLTAAVTSFVGSSLKAFGDFERSLNQVQAATGASGKEMKSMSDLALKLGADTKFSAGEAAAAMLELAKGGFSPAQIQAGALKNTMALAAAGGLDLAVAAGSMTAGMTAFGISAENSAEIANALAGAANASAADVSDMSQALSQVAAQASMSGLSLQETNAALAIFANNGVKGSDAGTSLKTMLQRLTPSTDAARNAMKALGLDFTNADGSFVSLADMAGQLQSKLAPLSAEQRQLALNTIFGSDASRAAAFLMKGGRAEVEKMTAAASDQTAAQKMADASMKGWAGTVEKLGGAWESFKVKFGAFIAPAIEPVLNGIGTAIDFVSDHMNVAAPIIAALAAVILGLGVAFTVMGTAAMFAAVGINLAAAPVWIVIAAIAALVAIIVVVIMYHKQIGAFFVSVWQSIWSFMQGVAAWFSGPFLAPFQAIAAWFSGAWSAVAGAVVGAWQAVVNFFTVTIPAAFNAVIAWFASLPGTIMAFLASLPGLALQGLQALAFAIGFGLGLIVGLFLTLPGKVWAIITSLWSTAVSLTQAGATAVWTWFSNLVTRAVGFVQALPGRIWSLITSLWSTAVSLTSAGANAVATWFSTMVSRAVSFVSSLPGRVTSLISSLWSSVTSLVSSGVSRTVAFFAELPGRAASAISSLPGRIKAVASGAINWLADAGRNVIQGLINGISSGIGRVTSMISNLASKVKSGFASALAIFSPSRVFKGYGENIVQGLVIGINKRAGSAVKAVTSLASGVGAIPFGLDGPGALSAANGGAGGTRTLNYYAAPGGGLSDEDDLFAAGSRARMVW